MKINRFWYSDEQKKISNIFYPFHTCHVFVNGEWREYTEWTTSLNGKCNWEDAILIVESVEDLPVMVDGIKQ